MRGGSLPIVLVLCSGLTVRAADEVPQWERDITPLLKRHCVKCHGPTKQEGKLNLATAGAISRGGKQGAAVVPHDAEASLIWQRVESDEMPPEMPLSAVEKELLKRWIVAGTPGLKRDGRANDADHWAFQKLPSVAVGPSNVDLTPLVDSAIDQFLVADLGRDGLTLSPQADGATLIRRVSFDVTGLPPTPEEIAEFLADEHLDAYERMVDRYLASPHWGERFGKVWLDAAGYADSNGYFSADSDRPLAFRYRDYVVRALNADLPFDQFLREQIAGDELAGLTVKNGGTADLAAPTEGSDPVFPGLLDPARRIEMLEATFYLRCGQDGTGESDGNPDEVRVDRYTVLETAMQNVSTGLLGLTIQCAKCHDHKFEPLTQRDYYSLQAVLIPAFPPEQWVKPNNRFVYASLPGEFEAWQQSVAGTDAEIGRLSQEISDWVRQHRPRGKLVFADAFDGTPESLADKWSNTAPGDDAPGGTAAVHVNSREAPGAIIVDGRLEVIEGGPGGDKWLSTRDPIDWTPEIVGATVQVTFDLIDHHVGTSKPAERIGYFLATHDFNDNSLTAGGNILVDGHPSSSTAVFVDYPGTDSRPVGVLGTTGYVPGRNYGIRVTNSGDGKFLLQHLIDWQVEEKTITLESTDLPDGGFGFEYCCDRSFIVDNVVVESFSPEDPGDPMAGFLKELKTRRGPLDDLQKKKAALGSSRPGALAWTTDVVDSPPPVHVLLRGNYHTPGELVEPAGYSILGDSAPPASELAQPVRGTGRRLRFANWLTAADSPRAALLARVQVNRTWQHHFGTGIVSTPDNFGLSGAPPTHPELLDWLAARFIRCGWSNKQVVRSILQSAAYRQSSAANERQLKLDADARRLSRFPIRRLDAEAIRDALLAASGDLDDRMSGHYVATSRTGTGETVVPEDNPGCRRRSLYLQQKRTQIQSLLQVFDAPSIVFNSTRRPRSTMPLQSLSLLNSDFVLARARSLGQRVQREATGDSERLELLFLLTTGHPPTDAELAASTRFLQNQTAEYKEDADAVSRAWADLSQTLLIGNVSLYLD
ncbi:MAG: PSD1 domain-containing protein [Planctomycetes bacterium]|nr:PSD1 domain-containing protein [Planctomycetota bacterium]